MNCIFCYSANTVKNGSSRGKQRWKCNNCRKTFGENSGYPKTTVPYQFIAFILYKNRLYKGIKLKIFTKIVNLFYKMLKDKEISKKTIFSWIRRYDDKFQNWISYEDSIKWFQQNAKPKYKKVIKVADKTKINKILDDIEHLRGEYYMNFLYWLKEMGIEGQILLDIKEYTAKVYEDLKETFKQILIKKNIHKIAIESWKYEQIHYIK